MDKKMLNRFASMTTSLMMEMVIAGSEFSGRGDTIR